MPRNKRLALNTLAYFIRMNYCQAPCYGLLRANARRLYRESSKLERDKAYRESIRLSLTPSCTHSTICGPHQPNPNESRTHLRSNPERSALRNSSDDGLD
ncbi:hypothetical protein ANTPLA_LOCUS2604 [Anthophora plagiata]